MTEDSIAPVSESCLLPQNGQTGWNRIITNDIPKLYICASWGLQTKEEFREYLKWFSALKEKNGLKAPDSDGVSDERIQEQLERLEELRQEIIYPYAEKMGNCEVVLLGGDHMIYEQKAEECGELIKSFVDGLDS